MRNYRNNNRNYSYRYTKANIHKEKQTDGWRMIHRSVMTVFLCPSLHNVSSGFIQSPNGSCIHHAYWSGLSIHANKASHKSKPHCIEHSCFTGKEHSARFMVVVVIVMLYLWWWCLGCGAETRPQNDWWRYTHTMLPDTLFIPCKCVLPLSFFYHLLWIYCLNLKKMAIIYHKKI